MELILGIILFAIVGWLFESFGGWMSDSE